MDYNKKHLLIEYSSDKVYMLAVISDVIVGIAHIKNILRHWKMTELVNCMVYYKGCITDEAKSMAKTTDIKLILLTNLQ
jgi:hypothetical protein